MIDPGSISGVKIISNSAMPVFTRVHARKHKGRTLTQYSKRVQKKWDKRFGYKDMRNFMTNGAVIYCHPLNYEILKSQLNQ